MNLNNNANAPIYDFIKGTSKDKGEDSYIFASNSKSIDVYSNQADPQLIFSGDPIPTKKHTFFFDYNAKEKILPYVTVDQGSNGSVTFYVCQIQGNMLSSRKISSVKNSPNLRNSIPHRTSFSVSPNRILISYFEYFFILCEYTTNPLKFKATNIMVQSTEPIAIFNMNHRDVICVLCAGCICHYGPSGPTEKDGMPYTFYFLDLSTQEWYSYLKLGSNQAEEVHFKVFNDSLVAAFQTNNNKHEFKLIGKKKVYKVKLEDMYAQVVEQERQAGPKKSENPLDFCLNMKSANISTMAIDDSNFAIEYRVIANIQINNNEHLVFDRNGKVCYYNKGLDESAYLVNDGFPNKIVEEVTEVYRDEFVMVIWVKIRKESGKFMKLNRKNVRDSSRLSLNTYYGQM